MPVLIPKSFSMLAEAGLSRPPVNENGVVFLFAGWANKHRLRIKEIRNGFPDCIAEREERGKIRTIRIEFEYASRNFRTHGHDAKKCDWIVCWKHNWTSCPKHLEVVEFQREFGAGNHCWTVCVDDRFKRSLERSQRTEWSVPTGASVGDWILFYRTLPDACVRDIFVIAKPVGRVAAGWRAGKDDMAVIKRICRLADPVFLTDLKHHRVLQHAGFVRGSLQGRRDVTIHWPYVRELIVAKNPSLRKTLATLVH